MLDDLPLDILDRFLTSLLDFQSLYAAIRISKKMYGVFQSRPTSILHAVTMNMIGPARPDALRLVQFMSGSDLPKVPALPGDEYTLQYPEMCCQAELLVENAKAVQELETFFSRRHKDCTSKSSVLSESESYRFHRSMYRYWLYRECFQTSWRQYLPQSDEHLYDYKAHVDFLKCLPSEEQREFAATCLFMQDTCIWLCRAYRWVHILGDVLPEIMMSCSPAEILYCIVSLQRDDRETLTDVLPDLNNLGHPVGEDFVWKALQNMGLEADSVDYNVLFEAVEEEQHTCAICHEPSQQNLWNKDNWDLLYGVIPSSGLITLLPGRLRYNLADAGAFRQRTNLSRLKYPVFLRRMLEERENQDDGLSDETWMCTGCLRSFIASNLLTWWLHRKMEVGLPIQENCWWGYDCRTQTHSTHHASRLNHFCAPSREANP